MRRDYGWSLRGERVFGTRPARTWKTLTLIGAVRLGERPLLMTHNGSVNSKVFVRFLRRRLSRMLRPGDIVVMDNLASHKTAAAKRALADLGVVPLYLPTYSPELNPIELWWAHLKRELRTLAIDARDELAKAARRLRGRLPIRHIQAWFDCAFRHSQSN